MTDLQKFIRSDRKNLSDDDMMVTYEGNKTKTIGNKKDGLYATATFLNYKGEVLYQTSVKDGETPVYNGPTPDKPSDGYYNYTFIWWNPWLGPIYEDTIFYPQYSEEIVPLINMVHASPFKGSDSTRWELLSNENYDGSDATGIGIEFAPTEVEWEYEILAEVWWAFESKVFVQGRDNARISLIDALWVDFFKAAAKWMNTWWRGVIKESVFNVINAFYLNPTQENFLTMVEAILATYDEETQTSDFVTWLPAPELNNRIIKLEQEENQVNYSFFLPEDESPEDDNKNELELTLVDYEGWKSNGVSKYGIFEWTEFQSEIFEDNVWDVTFYPGVIVWDQNLFNMNLEQILQPTSSTEEFSFPTYVFNKLNNLYLNPNDDNALKAIKAICTNLYQWQTPNTVQTVDQHIEIGKFTLNIPGLAPIINSIDVYLGEDHWEQYISISPNWVFAMDFYENLVARNEDVEDWDYVQLRESYIAERLSTDVYQWLSTISVLPNDVFAALNNVINEPSIENADVLIDLMNSYPEVE